MRIQSKKEYCMKLEKMQVTKLHLGLVLRLIGWEVSASFLGQSQFE